MATYNYTLGTRTAVTVTGLATLASAAYAASATIATSGYPDTLIEVTAATTNTPAGNKQVVVFAQGALDASTFTSGPISGTDTTDEPNLYFVGVVAVNSATTTHCKIFSLAAAFPGGRVPTNVKVVLKNDLGVALTSGTLFRSYVTDTIA